MESDGIMFRRLVMTGGIDSDGSRGSASAALDHIHGYYKKALHRLPPELIPSLLEAGFCFGFLDPVSNIVANTVSHELDNKTRQSRKRSRRAGGGNNNTKKKKKIEAGSRRAAMSKIVAESSSENVHLVPCASEWSDALLRSSCIAVRSLRGLVTFLTSYFRYLTTWDALRFLALADADLLVAVRLVQEVRDAHTFTVHDNTAKIALGCAAIAAFHPAAATLVSRSFSLASRADEASSLLETQSRISHCTIERLSELLLASPTKDMTTNPAGSPMQQAITRLQHTRMKAVTRLQQRKMENFQVGAGLEISLKTVLLDRIHLLYLEAISRIPKHELCSRHHRGLLKAGHCYGPCDPVTNIVLNTIWYGTMFPPKQHYEVAMICTKSLARVEFLSLCGLVAYVCVRFPAFSVYEAMRRLLVCNARLDTVVEMARTEGHDEDVAFSESAAYDTASRAANHPSPAALVEFATTVMPQVGGTLWSTPEVKRVLSSSDVLAISETLSQKLRRRRSLKKVRKLSGRATKIISAHREKFEGRQDTVVKMVEAALRRYAKQSGQEYELHFICDVKSKIPEDDVYYCSCSYSYPFSHMNILARRRGSQNDDADQVPTLFFIQCSKRDEDMEDKAFLCCPIFDLSKHAGRCHHCEYDGIKIIHPSSESYLGRCRDFEDMARGQNGVDVEGLVEHGQMNTLLDRTLEYEDSINFDPAWDVDFRLFIEQTARDHARYEELVKEHPPGSAGYSKWIDKMVYEASLTWSA